MSGEQQGHHLVADLALGHPDALLIARKEQHREQVAPVLARATLADDPVDNIVEAMRRSCELAVAGRRQPCRDQEAEAREAEIVEVLDPGAQAGDLRNPGGDVVVEEGSSDDAQRQRRHLVVEIEDLAVGPRVDAVLGIARHRPAVALDAFAMERRRRQPTVPQPLVALGGEEAVSEQRDEHPRPEALAEVGRAVNEDLLDLGGPYAIWAGNGPNRIGTKSPCSSRQRRIAPMGSALYSRIVPDSSRSSGRCPCSDARRRGQLAVRRRAAVGVVDLVA